MVPAAATASPRDLSLGRVTKRKVEEAILNLDSSIKHQPTATKKRKPLPTSSPGISTPLLVSLLPSSSSRTTAPTAPPPTPAPTSYTPLSLPCLLQRLSTYRLSTYSLPKPPLLLPSSLALGGWINSSPGRERVQCITCSKGVVLSPPSPAVGGWHSPAGRKLTDEYAKLVGEEGGGHDKTCPWRMRRSSRALYRVQVGGRRKVLAEVGEGAKALGGLKGIRVALSEGVLLQEKEWEAVLKVVREAQGSEEEPLPAELVLLSLFGWQVPSSSRPTTATPAILTCPLCSRQSLTSSYLPSPSASTPPLKTFNPLTSHASYCPLIDPYAGTLPPSTTSSSSSSSLSSLSAGVPSRAGWKLRVEAMLGGRRPTQGEGGEEDGREKRGTRELLSYVRGLLGPKGR